MFMGPVLASWICVVFSAQYLVKWEDYDASESTWEPESGLKRGCADMLKEFKLKQQLLLQSAPAPQQTSAKKAKTGK